ncbi:MAG: radical SAM protein [Aigarchaeota archaeon]|nr:radical SAM protein [Aigarchaeota archaeon]MCX8193051.1 radical SAM protein [Nitrososphaeria archaeon]MDW7986211.1 radical SAM protein [Nitrososphaerota archaeon]
MLRSWLTRSSDEKECGVCKIKSRYISNAIGVCVDCLRNRPEESREIIEMKHEVARKKYGLPPIPPRTQGGIPCKICMNNCVIGENEKGYCGLRLNRSGKLIQIADINTALLHYYLDSHVTNCCSSWFCPAGTGSGYPKYAVKPSAEIGYYNLALFFYGCSFNCLFCQNWTHKYLDNAERTSIDELIQLTSKNIKITCWCWFGGSPEPQLPFAITASRRLMEEKPSNRIVRVCFEWNGSANTSLVKRVGEIALESGGNIKFDLKAFTPIIHKALTGNDNVQVLRNFELIYREFYEKRKSLPILTATTLLVPHYVDEVEVEEIARFIASLDPEIPYCLLIFHPDFLMTDLPITPEKQFYSCLETARKYLKNVNASNLHLLGYPTSSLTWGLR